MRAIIVEDNALIAADLEDALADAGFEVVAHLRCYRSALAWIASNPPPDACVLDLVLGARLEGGNAAGEEGRRLLALMNDRSVATVLYSGYSREDAKLDGLDARAAYVGKGAPPGDVARALLDIIEAARLERNALSKPTILEILEGSVNTSVGNSV